MGASAVVAATVVKVGRMRGALGIWKGGREEKLEEREQNTCGSDVRNSVPGGYMFGHGQQDQGLGVGGGVVT